MSAPKHRTPGLVYIGPWPTIELADGRVIRRGEIVPFPTTTKRS